MFSTTHNVLISICRCSGIDPKYNTMIKTSHPSPLGAYKTSSPFMGSKYGLFGCRLYDAIFISFVSCRCFSRCNEALEQYGKEPIDWNIR
jgi:uracil-DNA glycosylase